MDRKGGAWGLDLSLGCAALSGCTPVKLMAQNTSCSCIEVSERREDVQENQMSQSHCMLSWEETHISKV